MSLGHRAVRRRPAWRPLLAWSLLWLVVAALVVLPHMHKYQTLSPIDELAHTDYLDQVGQGHLVTEGDKIGQVAMRAEACRGVDPPYSYPTPPCATEQLFPTMFQEKGFNTAYGDPPGYYVVTAVLAKGVRTVVPGVDDFVTAGRGVGILWLAAGLGITFLIGRRLGATQAAAAGATLLIATTPGIVHVSATITSDAADLLAGGVLVLVVMEVVGGRLGKWWIVPAAVACTLVKLSMLAVVGAAALYLVFDALAARRAGAPATTLGLLEDRDPAPDPIPHPALDSAHGAAPALDPTGPRYVPVAGTVRRRAQTRAPRRVVLSPLVVLLAASGLPILLWSLASGSLAAQDSPIPMRHRFYTDGLDLPELIDSFYSMVTPIRNTYVPKFMETRPVLVVAAYVNLLLLLGTAGLGWIGSWKDEATRWAAAAFVSMVVSGPALLVLIFVGSHAYIPLPGRYALGLVPLAAGTLAIMASRRRGGDWFLVVLGLLGMLALLMRTLS